MVGKRSARSGEQSEYSAVVGTRCKRSQDTSAGRVEMRQGGVPQRVRAVSPSGGPYTPTAGFHEEVAKERLRAKDDVVVETKGAVSHLSRQSSRMNPTNSRQPQRRACAIRSQISMRDAISSLTPRTGLRLFVFCSATPPSSSSPSSPSSSSSSSSSSGSSSSIIMPSSS